MQLDVVTPKGRLMTATVQEVIAPGILGELGVLPGHIPFLTGLKPGVLRYRTGDGGGTLAIAAGFLEVDAGDRVIVLTDQGMDSHHIDVAAAKKERDDAQNKLDHWDSDDAGLHAELVARVAWAEARIAAAGELATTH